MNFFKILVMSDSRLNDFQEYLDLEASFYHIPLVFNVVPVPGVGIIDLISKSIEELQYDRYHFVYYSAGINDLTTLNKITRIASPIYDDIGQLVNLLTDKYQLVKTLLEQHTKGLVICQLVGMDVNKYNRGLTDHETLQNVIDEGVVQVNRVIASINNDLKVVPPWWAKQIHVYDKRSEIHLNKYEKLYDGLHLSNFIKMNWAEALVRSVYTNLDIHY